MKPSLTAESVDEFASGLSLAFGEHSRLVPAVIRQPVHTVYGGAHLFTANTTEKLRQLAINSFNTFAPNAKLFAQVFAIPPELALDVFSRVTEKLENHPVEDLRIDFEDGYGVRSEADEDDHALFTANQTVAAMSEGELPPFFGIRIKSFSPETYRRSIRTLDLYLTTLTGLTVGKLPHNFVITLPKVVSPVEVLTLSDILDELEIKLGIDPATIKIEIMVETVQAVATADGRFALPSMVDAGRGRVSAAHFGAYDYTADCGITSSRQDLRHPACDFARQIMQVSLAGRGIHLSDGATTIMPVPIHRGVELSADQIEENREAVHGAWKIHYDNCRHALDNGFYQGWDLHPAQLPARYAAVYTFFLEGHSAASDRLKSFIERGAQANLVGNTFDDAATGQGLLNFFLRAINCGAMTEREVVEKVGIGVDELRKGSFTEILNSRLI